MKLRLPRRRILRAFIYLLCVALVLIAADMVWVQMRRSITPGFDTTRIVSPVLDDGRVDYATAIEDHFSAGITPQNNAAIPILQALGRAALPKTQPPDGVTSQLGMAPLPEQGDYFVPYEKFCQDHGAPIEDDPTGVEGKLIFPPKVGTQTKQWLGAMSKPMALLTDASKRSRYFIPFNCGHRYELLLEVLLPHLAPLRQTHRAFLTRAMLRMEAGDFAGFRDDVMTVHRLARLVSQSTFLVERMVASALENSACGVERAVAASGKLSSAQAKQLAAELAATGDLQRIDDSINISERYLWLDVLQVLAKRSPTEAGRLIGSVGGSGFGSMAPVFWLLPVPYEASMRTANHYDDGVVAVLALPTYPQRKAAFELWLKQVDNQSRNWATRLNFAEWSTNMLLPNFSGAEDRYESALMQDRLTQIALGLAAYKADHKEYPTTLAALTPDYLPSIPNDIFSARPVIYAPTANGFTLYSVGPNMHDDGGKSQKPADDIVASTP